MPPSEPPAGPSSPSPSSLPGAAPAALSSASPADIKFVAGWKSEARPVLSLNLGISLMCIAKCAASAWVGMMQFAGRSTFSPSMLSQLGKPSSGGGSGEEYARFCAMMWSISPRRERAYLSLPLALKKELIVPLSSGETARPPTRRRRPEEGEEGETTSWRRAAKCASGTCAGFARKRMGSPLIEDLSFLRSSSSSTSGSSSSGSSSCT
mmetsp:Transcript_24828/g.80201  ORF Transcript_24828/g.80201 Transcript_24828/m.80201 type:complete len:209 (+) Transcript_24828:914-1540(+)